MIRPVNLRLTWQYVVAFVALMFLCGMLHEFAHHFAGAAVCGGFGTMTFNSFKLASGCESSPWRLWPTLSGPLLTFALLWLGMVSLRSADESRRQFGFALIFANFPVNRMGFVLLGSNDEQWFTRSTFGDSRIAFWATVLLVWAACVPPLIAAYQSMGSRWRGLWFAGFFLLPFAFIALLAGVILEDYLLLGRQVLAGRIIGVPYLAVAVGVVSLSIYLGLRRHLIGPVDMPASAPVSTTAAT